MMAPTYILRLAVLALLIATTFFDWKREAVLRQQIEALKYETDHDVLASRLKGAIAIIRHYNGDKAVMLPNPDGSVFIDSIAPGESVSFGIAIAPPEEPRQ